MSFETEAETPLDANAPSENFVGMLADNPDVWSGDLYATLTQGLRDADAQTGEVLRRLLKRPTELIQRTQQKIWKLRHIVDYRHTPDELLDLLRSHVAFGPGQGVATTLAEGLSDDELRILIKIAAKFWKTRGRKDALEDAIRFFASGITPQIDDWFYLRLLIDEVLLGVEETGGSDPWLLLHPETNATDANTVVIRVPDLGTLDRTLVENLAQLMRAPSEEFEIAYPDFLDTFRDGRLGHWETIDGTAATFIKADSSVTPKQLPGLDFRVGARERVDVPNASTWKRYFWKMIGYWGSFAAEVQLRFYVQDDDNCYFWRLVPPDTAELIRLIAGVPTTLASSTAVELTNPSPRSIWINVTDNGGGGDPNFFQLYVDGEIEVEHSGDTTYRDGTIEVNCVTSGVSGFILARTELFQAPLAIVTLGPP